MLASTIELLKIGAVMPNSLFLFTITAVAEIFGCYAVYGWLKLGRPSWWVVPGAAALSSFCLGRA
jgi:small multidrug resistance family-3 protein